MKRSEFIKHVSQILHQNRGAIYYADNNDMDETADRVLAAIEEELGVDDLNPEWEKEDEN